jgi:hypothetical protein
MSKDTFTKINAGKSPMVILRAGYVEKSGLEDLFIGNVVSAWIDYKKPNIEAHFTVHDGENTIRTKKVKLTSSAGASAKRMMKDVIKQIGLPEKVAGAVDAVADKVLNKGMSFLGTANVALTEIADTLEMEWSIQDGKLVLVKKGHALQTAAVKLTPKTGLIGSPEKINSVVPSSSGEQKTVEGWKLTSLLMPSIVPLCTIVVESRDIPPGSTFKVISVEHRGDTHGSDWMTTTEAVLI